jgi:hypothetical protein
MAKAKHSTINLDKAAGSDIPGSLRLNNEDRHALLNALLRHKFGKRGDEDNAQEYALAVRIYDMTYTPEQQAWMAQGPEGALPMHSTVYVYLDGKTHNLRFCLDRDEKNFPTHEERRVFNSYIHSYDRSGVPMLSAVEGGGSTGEKLKLAQDLEAYFLAKSQREDAYRKATDQIKQALKAFTTWRNLIAEWPEAEAITRAVLLERGYTSERKTATLPVVQISELNKLLDLPPEEEAA